MNKMNVTQALKKFDSLLDKYNDLPIMFIHLNIDANFMNGLGHLKEKKNLKITK
ncbi:hypothetical protein [Clostridioides difficile]|uniref:hypothetical protein n=1 Tax=Clostridioides difficile TaxID=1496 RepID=UPI001FEDC8C5|nr:hypothetical protein [Clostridioides difficile]